MKNSLRLSPFPVVLTFKTDEKYLKPTDLAATFDTEQGAMAVVVRPSTLSADFLDRTLVHESTHVVSFLEQYIGTRFDDETRAYETEFVWDFLKRCVENEKSRAFSGK